VTVALKIVSSAELPDPPYPPDTRVNGWRFELDVERIKRSDTWVMASPDWRPWLLMVWMTAWDQRPAGSLPADHAVIAAHIGMDSRVFSAHADILLRGFVAHRDGRLYHPVVVDQVLALLDRREQERERKARWRDKKTDVPRDRHGTDLGKTLQEQEQEQVNKSALRADVRIPADSDPPLTKNCPVAKIVQLYHERLPELPKVEKVTTTRAGLIRQRWREDLPTLEHWENFFAYVRESRFLMGKAPPTGTRPPFIADLEWLVRPSNFTKIAEERYHRG
jgi:hypothetical protein